MKKLIVNYWPIILILLIGTALRMWGLEKIPAYTDWDERAIGYNAYSIAQIGRDEWGVHLPWVFKSFGDYKLPLYIYLTAIPVKLFGLNPFSIKITAALCGSLSVLLIYLIALNIFKNKPIALMTGIFFAFSSYGIFYSHLAQETILANFLIITGLWLETIFIKNKKIVWWCLSMLVLAVSVFAYGSARIISPILLVLFLIINFYLSDKKKAKLIIPLIVFCFSLLMIFIQFKTGGLSRFREAGIFGNDKGLVIGINELRFQDKNNKISQLVHNKPIFYLITLTKNYLTHFSPDFLIGFRELNVVQESLSAPLFWIILPFYYYGLYLLVISLFKVSSKEEKLAKLVLLIWIILSPIPSAITEGSPSAKRFLGGLGSMEIVIAYGLHSIIKQRFRFKRTFVFSFILLYAISVISFLNFFFFVFPEKYKPIYAMNENLVAAFIKKNYLAYDYFVYSGFTVQQPQIFPLFELSYPPEKYLAEKKWSINSGDGWYWINSFGKFIFYYRIDKNSITHLNNLPGKKIALLVSKPELNDITPLLPKNAVPKSLSNLTPQSNEDKQIFLIEIK
jgi:4-amino-4-deoxy-L-arabinose transferase-like glycosyltransferase